MYTELGNRLSVTTTAEVTQAVSMEGANAVNMDLVIYSNSAAVNCELDLQGSNDLQNWKTLTSVGDDQIAEQNEGHYTSYNTTGGTMNNVGFAYVRLHCKMASAATAIVSIGINTFDL